MPHDAEKYLYDIREAAKLVRDFTVGRTVDDYLQDVLLRSAVERQLGIVGEAMILLRRVAPDVADKISEHRSIIGFRHILVHGYDALNHELVWEVVTSNIPILIEETEALLGPAPGDP